MGGRRGALEMFRHKQPTGELNVQRTGGDWGFVYTHCLCVTRVRCAWGTRAAGVARLRDDQGDHSSVLSAPSHSHTRKARAVFVRGIRRRRKCSHTPMFVRGLASLGCSSTMCCGNEHRAVNRRAAHSGAVGRQEDSRAASASLPTPVASDAHAL